MFRHLRVKLTVLYTGLFAIALLVIGASGYAAIDANSKRLAAQQMVAAGGVFDELWRERLAHYQAAAGATARAPFLVDAVRLRDDIATHNALEAAGSVSLADIAFVVTREGLIVGAGAGVSVPPGMQAAFAREATPSGVMRVGATLYQAAASPLPENLGWIVLGARLSEGDLATLERTSPTPLRASIYVRTSAGWHGALGARGDDLGAFLTDLASASPEIVRTDMDARISLLAQPLASLDGARAVLVLSHPLDAALSPYRALFGTLALVGILGVVCLAVATWLLAGTITRPLLALEDAARRVQEGVYETIALNTRDELARLAESFSAMSSAIREREKRITHLAFHDTETRLPNRAALERKLAAAPHPERLFLAAIGVNRFAHVRGAIGYALAGLLMRSLGQRLARLVPNAPMARLSSDVLGVALLADSEADARRRAAALVDNLEQSLSLEGQVVDVHVTLGVAQPRVKDESTASMIERASVALDQARNAGQKFAVFDPAAYGDPARNLSLMGEMRAALENGEMVLAHQPKYDFRNGAIRSAESLVRWRHPRRGAISPDLFVPMAEETGHIRALTEWVLRQAVADQRTLARAGRPLTLAVNISARLLSDTDFAHTAIACVREAPHSICFEITETAVVDNPKTALENIELFAAAGVHIAIDDYGSGLSSLAYLKQLPAHELKIDKMFIESVTNSQRDALLVRSTVDLAHGLGMAVTAEGVETPAAFSLLASMRCDFAQGYLISRPVSVDELVALLGDERRMRHYEQTAAAGAHSAPVDARPRSA